MNLSKNEMERVEVMNRSILKDFLRLPQSTPNIAIYHEFNVCTIEIEIWKRKLRTWYRINRRESNSMIKEMRKTQIKKNLPWIKKVIEIGRRLNIDLLEAKKLKKTEWKALINKKSETLMKEYLDSQIDRTKRYKENIEEERNYGKPKNYFCLPKNLQKQCLENEQILWILLQENPTKERNGSANFVTKENNLQDITYRNVKRRTI